MANYAIGSAGEDLTQYGFHTLLVASGKNTYTTAKVKAVTVRHSQPGDTIKASGTICVAKRSEPNWLAPVGSLAATAKLPVTQ